MRPNLMELPNLRDEQGTRQWVLRLLSFADMVADITPNIFDDKILQWLTAVVENDETWTPIYDIITELLDTGAIPDDQKVRRALGDPEIDPALIILLIDLAKRFYDWWSNR